VLDVTGADGVMIGRAAQGRPWLFREIEHYLKTGEHLPPAEVTEIHEIQGAPRRPLRLLRPGNRVQGRPQAHLLVQGLVGSAAFRKEMNVLPSIDQQMQAVNDFFGRLAEEHRSKIHRGGVGSMSQHDIGNASRIRWSSICDLDGEKPPPSMTWS
jgi:tRNA-dihydrouridine synthase B